MRPVLALPVRPVLPLLVPARRRCCLLPAEGVVPGYGIHVHVLGIESTLCDICLHASVRQDNVGSKWEAHK